MANEQIQKDAIKHVETAVSANGLSLGRESDAKAARNEVQRARVQALRGKYPRLCGTVDELMNERHEEAEREMQKDSA